MGNNNISYCILPPVQFNSNININIKLWQIVLLMDQIRLNMKSRLLSDDVAAILLAFYGKSQAVLKNIL